jgi:hypothetical protein
VGLIRRPLLRAGTLSPFQPRRRASDAEAPPPAPPRPRRHPLGRLHLATVRVAAVILLMAGVALVAGNVFDRVEWTLFVAVAFGAAGTVGAWRLPARVPAMARLALAVAAVLAAMCLVAVLADGTVRDAVPGATDGPRRLLTTEWPSPADPTVLATLALLLGGATALAVDLARRPRLHLAPLAPVLVTLITVVGLSAPRRPPWWLLAVLAGGALLVALARHGDKPGSRLATLRGEGAVAVTLVAIAAASAGTAAVVAWTGRADPRQIVDADRSASLLRPLEATVALRGVEPPIEQFRITDESPLIGQRMPTRWRIAALDTYDGQHWLPEAEVRPIGDRLGPDASEGADAPATGHYRIELLAEHTELVPLPGPPIELDSDPSFGVETDVDRVVVRLTEPAARGTTLRLVAELAPTAGDVIPAAIVARPVGEIEGGFTDIANELAGGGEALARLQHLEQELRSWQLDRSAPGGGQQLRLLTDFVTQNRRGTDEQFTAAFVLLARSLGFDARVSTGFAIGPREDASSPLTVRSNHAAAWPEVNVAGAGWLAFDPVPEEPTSDTPTEEPTPELQTPAAAQPPIDPPARPGDTEPEEENEEDEAEPRWGSLTSWVARASLVVATVAIPALVALAAIVFLKQMRRRQRLQAGSPSEVVRGAWANTTDALVDAGLTIESSWTDDRIAAMGAPLVGTAPHDLRRLATMSTAATFGPTASSDEVTDATKTERLLRVAVAARLTRWQRLRWHVSLRSMRRATRSPVVGG